MENIQPELKLFIEKYIVIHKIRNVDLSILSVDTSLDLDLNLFDQDLVQFMNDFVDKLNIDYSRFDWNKYGYPKGTFAISLIRSFLNYKLHWVKRLAHFSYNPKIKIIALQRPSIPVFSVRVQKSSRPGTK